MKIKIDFRDLNIIIANSTVSAVMIQLMGEVAGKKPKAMLTVPMTVLKGGKYADMVKKFAEEIKA